jgi:hypothetical protein
VFDCVTCFRHRCGARGASQQSPILRSSTPSIARLFGRDRFSVLGIKRYSPSFGPFRTPHFKLVIALVEDRLLLPIFKPMIARNPPVVLEGFAEMPNPFGKSRRPYSGPSQNLGLGYLGLLGPFSDVVDDLIANLMGNPFAIQGSPNSFFSWTCSWSNSAMTSFLD